MKKKENNLKVFFNNLKEIFKMFIEYLKRHKIFAIINAIVLIIVIVSLFIKILLSLVLIILWIIGLIIYVKVGGKKMLKKKRETIEEKQSNTELIEISKDNKKVKKKKKEKADEDIKKKKKKKRKIIKFLLNFILIMILLGLIASIVFIIYIVINAPDFNPDNLYRAESSVIYDKDGNQIAKIGVEKRKKVSYDDLPQVLIDAIVATEDSRFFQHNGFDLPRFAKASFGQIINKLTHRGNAGGGSTISMQVVKNNFTTVDQTITRKFTDIYIAMFKLEKNYSKQEIMEYYVNTPFLGNGSYGVEQACQSYFGKSVSDINLSEAAIIAGLFQAPSSYDPYMYPENTEERRETVLYLMRHHGYITEEEEELANSIPVTSLLNKTNSEVSTNEYQPFIDIVLDEVEEKTGKNPYTTGMKIYTTLDTAKQRVLNNVMSGATWAWKDDKIQAGVGVIDVDNGAILAVGAGRNRVGERQYNYGTMIEKQIGSTAKPIFDYGPAIEYNNLCLSTPFYDGPYTYSSGASLKNWDNSYQGVITLKKALAESRNIPAVKAFQSVDNSKIVEFATNLGMTPEIDSTGYIHEAHALGAFTGTNPVQLAGAYSAFANGGYFSKPYSVNKVEYIDTGKTVSLKSKKAKVMSDATAYMITDTLVYAVESYGNIGGTVYGVKLAAKTGTTNLTSEIQAMYGYPYYAVNDLWTVGYTPEFSVALWYGYDLLERGYYNVDGYQKNVLYRQIVRDLAATDTNAKNSFDVPSSLIKVTVERETYPVLLPGDNTPDDMKVTEYCKAGTEPTTKSTRYNKLDNTSNLKSKTSDEKVTLTWDSVKEPTYNSLDAFKKANSVLYKQHVEEKFAEMQVANGSFGYEIVETNIKTGKSEVLDFTTNTTYSFERRDYDATYTVKTKYQNNEITKSNGVSVDVAGKKKEININDYKVENSTPITSLTIDGSSASLSNLSSNIKVYDKNKKDVTSKCKITPISPCTVKTGNGKCTISNDTATFTSAGTYVIEYNVLYEDTALSAPSTYVTVNGNETEEETTAEDSTQDTNTTN